MPEGVVLSIYMMAASPHVLVHLCHVLCSVPLLYLQIAHKSLMPHRLLTFAPTNTARTADPCSLLPAICNLPHNVRSCRLARQQQKYAGSTK